MTSWIATCTIIDCVPLQAHRVAVQLPGSVEMLRPPQAIHLADPVAVRRHVLAPLLGLPLRRRTTDAASSSDGSFMIATSREAAGPAR